MAASLGATWRSFWHTMTSYDRHASHDSPYRTGQHVPLNPSSNRHPGLTSIATSAVGSHQDIQSPYIDGAPSSKSVVTLQSNYPDSPGGPRPSSPYSPGMRSTTAGSQRPPLSDGDSFDSVSAGEIQLQNFKEGLPPPPPVAHSWKRIDRWAEDNYEELYDQLSEGATNNDLNELEHMLDCSLPLEVRESLQIHDGQERGGTPTGIIFGCMLLDCEEIVQEWQQWRRVNVDFLNDNRVNLPTTMRAAAGSSSTEVSPASRPGNPLWRQDLQAKQDSQPANAIRTVYAHPAWIPLARDWGGNNVAVDLAPGPMGKWGQVILFGRDYDCKYVIARSWSAFLAMVADDLGSEKWFVDEETQELKLREFKTQNVEPGYLDILRWRMDQKYGRKPPKRKAATGLSINLGGIGGGVSPYNQPASKEPERGRTPSRSHTMPVSSPLARVAEEIPSLSIKTSQAPSSFAGSSKRHNSLPLDKLPEPALPVTNGTALTSAPEAGAEVIHASPAQTTVPNGLGVLGVDLANGTSPADPNLKTIDL